jgi:essential nuclear protein 1
MPKTTTPIATARQERRHNPLEHDLTAIGLLKSKSGKRKSRHEDEEEKFVDSKASRKILRIAQELADDDESQRSIQQGEKINAAFDLSSRLETSDGEEQYEDDGDVWGDEDDVVEEIELDPNDQETFNKFFPTEDDPLLKTGWGVREADGPGGRQTTNLAALILEKIDAFEAAQARASGAEELDPADDDFEIPAKVVEVYTQ